MPRAIAVSPPGPATECVGAVIVDECGRYLLQLRDAREGLPLPDHWVMFGGGIEEGETSEEAIRRELREELGFEVAQAHWYTESVFVLPRQSDRLVHRIWFIVPVLDRDISSMRLVEGQAMRLFTLDDMLTLPKVAPWDLQVALTYSRHASLFDEALPVLRP